MPKRICIVDDEESIIAGLKQELETLRPAWKVVGFNSGLNAIREIISGGIDLVITDIAMPDMDGYELFWRIKDHDPSLPVIMMTGFGYDPNHVLVRAKTDGLQDILFKPFDIDKLIALIESKLEPEG
ncbi:MAG TPA: response regulator [Candidatus Syntrophosphaera sp.]|nr:response regulator [Candidatus Cloacimonadota bacterium]OQB89497.1 MAG: C4-dicarboxylate transport transcriptional regulatory protein DctD [Candidatus Cloacimonetes bacterium ADurb.Bin117]HNU54847.1 response regulator [Candidatus Syntrophosphaera sp.]NLH93152.1 response regulator [Candidatus Cloacimonadota bacterium]HOG31093.1 response regulator [Candidatus Cloacimonadota bacterium]